MAPTRARKKEIEEAKEKAKSLLIQARPLVQEAETLADKFGFNLDFDFLTNAYSRIEYIPHHGDDSMWMPSDDEVEGSGYLTFDWTSSTEGTWRSESDVE